MAALFLASMLTRSNTKIEGTITKYQNLIRKLRSVAVDFYPEMQCPEALRCALEQAVNGAEEVLIGRSSP